MIRRHRLWAGLICFALLTLFNTLPPPSRLTVHSQGLLLIGGMIGLLGSVWQNSCQHLHLKTLAQLSIIFLAALLIRLWQLESAIPRLIDEMNSILAINHLWYGWTEPQLLHPYSEVTAFTWLYPYLQSWFTPSLAHLRLISAMMGSLGVVMAYLLARSMINAPVGLATAMLLATFPPHIHFSRIGINNIADPLFGIAAFFWLWRGIQQRHLIYFVASGLCLGLTHYFYEGGRLLYTPLMLLWLAWLSLIGNRAWVRPTRQQLGMWLLSFGALVLPMFAAWTAHDLAFFPRFAANRTPETGDLWHNLQIALNGIIQSPEYSDFYGGNTALILSALLPFWGLGLIIALSRLRHVWGALVIFGTGAALIGNGLLSSQFHAPRYVVIFPLMALSMALGSWGVVSLVPRLGRAQRQQMMLVIAIALSAIQLHYYFGTHLPNYYADVFGSESTLKDFDDLLLRIAALPPYTDVHIITPTAHEMGAWMRSGLRYFAAERHITVFRIKARGLQETRYLSYLDWNYHQAFFVLAEDHATRRALHEWFGTLPRLQFSSARMVPLQRQFALYFFAASDQK